MTTKVEMDEWQVTAVTMLKAAKNAIIAPASRKYIMTHVIADDADAATYQGKAILLLRKYEQVNSTSTPVNHRLSSVDNSLQKLNSNLLETVG